MASVDSNGKITARKSGTAKITAYLADSNGNMCLGSEDVCTVKVEAPTIKVSPVKVSLVKGCTKKISATVKGSSKKVTWTSSNRSVAAVSSSGVITAKKKGTATITAKANGVSAKCKVSVSNPTIRLSAKSVSIYKGKTRTLKATVTGKSKKVTWTSSNKNVATVSSKGKITAKKKGTAVISAKANGVTARCTVYVTAASAPAAGKAKLSRTSLSLTVGTGEDLYLAIGTKKYTTSVTWSSSNPSAVAVNKYGRVTGVRPGSSTITAKRSGYTCTCKVTVKSVKERTEVQSYLNQSIWAAAPAFHVGEVQEYPAGTKELDHSCPVPWNGVSVHRYYAGVSCTNAEYSTASYPIRFEASASGEIAEIESNSGDDYTFAGLFLGMSGDDASNMLGSRGCKFLSFSSGGGGVRVTFVNSNDRKYYVKYLEAGNVIKKITIYSSSPKK